MVLLRKIKIRFTLLISFSVTVSAFVVEAVLVTLLGTTIQPSVDFHKYYWVPTSANTVAKLGQGVGVWAGAVTAVP